MRYRITRKDDPSGSRLGTSVASLPSLKGGHEVLHNFKIEKLHREDFASPLPLNQAVLLLIEGRGVFCCEEKKLEAGPGDIFILAADQCIEFQPAVSRPVEAILVHWLVHFSLQIPAMGAFDLAGPETMLKLEGSARELKAATLIIEALHSEKSLSAAQNQRTLPALFQSLALIVDRQIAQYQPRAGVDSLEASRKRLQNILDQIASNLADDPDWPKVARSLGFTEKYFRKFFTNVMGLSPMQYLLQSRVLRAEARILSTERSISEVCYEVGFQSISAFNSAFRKYNGSYPSYVRSLAKDGHSLDLQLQNISFNNTMRPKWSLPYPRVEKAGGIDWQMVDIRPLCNRPVRSYGGLFGGPLSLSHLPTGETYYHGIPFDLLEETRALPNSGLLMGSKIFRGSKSNPVPTQLKITLPAYARSIYVLHLCAWAKDPVPFASYRLEYEEAKEKPLLVVNICPRGLHSGKGDAKKFNIQDWWPSYEQIERSDARPVALESAEPTKALRFLYTLEIVNPNPDRRLHALLVNSSRNLESTLAIFAITALL